MENKIKTSPKDFFLHLAMIAALYVSVTSVITLLFRYIDVAFPDRLDVYYDPYSAGIRWAIASLIVVFPIYIYITRTLNKEIREDPQKSELKIRKWLVYFTLFVAGITVIIDLIVLLNAFLGGDELTASFLLKVLSIFVVGATVFGYYIYDLKGKWVQNPALSRKVSYGALAVIVLIIVGGFFIMGSPAKQRMLRFDNERISGLESIQWQIINFWQAKGRLPAELSELENSLGFYSAPVDPETEEPYKYNILSEDDLKFELCADFNLASGDDSSAPYRPTSVGVQKSDGWKHEAGHQCFERTIDPDLYPVREKLQ